MPIEMLKVIDLSYSESLIKTPDFHEVPNPKELNLKGCKSLREVHESIGVLKMLVFLNMEKCRNLVTLPNSLCDLKSLKTFMLFGCSKLKKMPDRLWDMTCLVELDAVGIGIQELELAEKGAFLLPSWLMPKEKLQISNPMAIVFPSLSAVPSLKKLNLSYCNLGDGAIPSDLRGFPLLEFLDLSGNNFISLPSSISRLSRLSHLPEKHNLKNFRMDSTNCSKLNDYKQNTNVVLFRWLKSCMLPFLKIRRLLRIEEMCQSKDQFGKICHKKGIEVANINWLPQFSVRLPGTKIPEWFNYQSVYSKKRLSSCEKWLNIAGFIVCVRINSLLRYPLPLPSCEFKVYAKTGFVWSTSYRLGFSRDVFLKSDYLYFFFVANRMIDLYEEQSPTEMEVTFSRYRCKNFGMCIVRENEIRGLIQSILTVEEMSMESQYSLFQSTPEQAISMESQYNSFRSALDQATNIKSSYKLFLSALEEVIIIQLALKEVIRMRSALKEAINMESQHNSFRSAVEELIRMRSAVEESVSMESPCNLFLSALEEEISMELQNKYNFFQSARSALEEAISMEAQYDSFRSALKEVISVELQYRYRRYEGIRAKEFWWSFWNEVKRFNRFMTFEVKEFNQAKIVEDDTSFWLNIAKQLRRLLGHFGQS
ncbi:hypothetical protein JCGZ_20052 [Jatropha curcas]|uniref:C-JID domain-containing protein n=1 Tax=Jatropha curcas TaxID=180498 RepID=A0A067L7J0_JATCU|nr:hypothetical protein JCGZ_20052 [Jatropha curcas]